MNTSTRPPPRGGRAEVALAQGVQVLAASEPHVGETLKALVRLLEPGVQPGATEETAGAVVLRDEAAEEPVEVLHRLDQAEHAAMPVVDGDVLETRSQARRGQEPVAGPALEGEIDASDLIEVVEDHQRRRVVDQRDAAGLQPAALRPARKQAE